MKMKDGDMGKKPFKLEDLDKRSVYSVPDGYFNQLPTKISARVVEPKSAYFNFNFAQSLKYALPVILLLGVAVAVIFNENSNSEVVDVQTMLAEVSDQDLIEYLEQTDVTTDEVLNQIVFVEGLDEVSNEVEIIEEEALSEDELLELYQEFETTGEYL